MISCVVLCVKPLDDLENSIVFVSRFLEARVGSTFKYLVSIAQLLLHLNLVQKVFAMVKGPFLPI